VKSEEGPLAPSEVHAPPARQGIDNVSWDTIVERSTENVFARAPFLCLRLYSLIQALIQTSK
jgi:hypothetical protein